MEGGAGREGGRFTVQLSLLPSFPGYESRVSEETAPEDNATPLRAYQVASEYQCVLYFSVCTPFLKLSFPSSPFRSLFPHLLPPLFP